MKTSALLKVSYLDEESFIIKLYVHNPFIYIENYWYFLQFCTSSSLSSSKVKSYIWAYLQLQYNKFLSALITVDLFQPALNLVSVESSESTLYSVFFLSFQLWYLLVWIQCGQNFSRPQWSPPKATCTNHILETPTASWTAVVHNIQLNTLLETALHWTYLDLTEQQCTITSTRQHCTGGAPRQQPALIA